MEWCSLPVSYILTLLNAVCDGYCIICHLLDVVSFLALLFAIYTVQNSVCVVHAMLYVGELYYSFGFFYNTVLGPQSFFLLVQYSFLFDAVVCSCVLKFCLREILHFLQRFLQLM